MLKVSAWWSCPHPSWDKQLGIVLQLSGKSVPKVALHIPTLHRHEEWGHHLLTMLGNKMPAWSRF